MVEKYLSASYSGMVSQDADIPIAEILSSNLHRYAEIENGQMRFPEQ